MENEATAASGSVTFTQRPPQFVEGDGPKSGAFPVLNV